MKYFQPGCPLAIYMFGVTVPAKNTKEGIKNVLPIIKRCEEFAEALQIVCSADHVGAFDGSLWVRLRFYIQEPEDSILLKVPALFSFAAVLKLEFVNQFFTPKKAL